MRMTQPEIRFKGFNDDWEEKTLGEISDKVLKGSAKADSLEIGQNAVYLDTKYLNTKSNPITTSANANVSENDVLILWDGSKAGVVYKGTKGVLGSTLKSLRISSGTSSDYVYQVLKNSESIIFDRYRTPNIPHVVKDFTRKFKIQLPTLPEQQRIGALFSKYDAIIALHEQKLEELNALKKGLLQQMFPKNGAKIPELRFEGFEDVWEERKFFESIASTIDFRGRTPKKLGMDWSDSGYLALSALNVKNGYIDPLADAHYGDEKLYRKWMSGRELKKGQVLFTTEAPMGNVAQVPDDNGYILSQRVVAFESKEDMMSNDFLAVLLKSPLVFNNLLALSSGGTAKGVSQKSLKRLSITVPFDIEAQQKIGELFKQLDARISNEQTKIEQLKAQKQGLLQRML